MKKKYNLITFRITVHNLKTYVLIDSSIAVETFPSEIAELIDTTEFMFFAPECTTMKIFQPRKQYNKTVAKQKTR